MPNWNLPAILSELVLSPNRSVVLVIFVWCTIQGRLAGGSCFSLRQGRMSSSHSQPRCTSHHASKDLSFPADPELRPVKHFLPFVVREADVTRGIERNHTDMNPSDNGPAYTIGKPLSSTVSRSLGEQGVARVVLDYVWFLNVTLLPVHLR